MKVIATSCYLLFALLLLPLTACQQTYVVKGTTDAASFKGRQVALKIPTCDGTWTAVDSCQVTHGVFFMKGHVDTVALTTLFVDDVPVMPIFLESGILHVDISSFSRRVLGTPLNNELYSFINKSNALQARVTELGHTESQMIMSGMGAEAVRHYVDSVYSVVADSMAKLVDDLDPVVRHFLTAASN